MFIVYLYLKELHIINYFFSSVQVFHGKEPKLLKFENLAYKISPTESFVEKLPQGKFHEKTT